MGGGISYCFDFRSSLGSRIAIPKDRETPLDMTNYPAASAREVSSPIFFSQQITYSATVRRTIERFDKALKALGEEIMPPTPIMFDPR